MRLIASCTVKTAMVAAIAMSTSVIPTATPASAAPSSDSAVLKVTADNIGEICRKHNPKYIVRKYFRGPVYYTLRCGTKTWGWKHIKRRHGWNRTMDRKISAAIWSGEPNGRSGFSTYTKTCPKIEKFRTIIGTPAGPDDLLTAYKVTTAAASRC